MTGMPCALSQEVGIGILGLMNHIGIEFHMYINVSYCFMNCCTVNYPHPKDESIPDIMRPYVYSTKMDGSNWKELLDKVKQRINNKEERN